MCTLDDPITAAYESYRKELVDAGLLIPLGVPGVYGRSGVFEGIVEHFEAFVTRMGAPQRRRSCVFRRSWQAALSQDRSHSKLP